MTDLLTDYEDKPVKIPILFWVVCILYLAQVVLANITNFLLMQELGFTTQLLKYPSFLILSLVDVFQVFLLYYFFRKKRIAICFIPLIQGMYAAMFGKRYYVIITTPGIPHIDIILSAPLSVFFCINAILLVSLTLQERLMNYFIIPAKLRLLILSLTAIIIFAILLFFNEIS